MYANGSLLFGSYGAGRKECHAGRSDRRHNVYQGGAEAVCWNFSRNVVAI